MRSCILEILKGCPVERALRISNALPIDLGSTSSGRRSRPERGLGVEVTHREVRSRSSKDREWNQSAVGEIPPVPSRYTSFAKPVDLAITGILAFAPGEPVESWSTH